MNRAFLYKTALFMGLCLGSGVYFYYLYTSSQTHLLKSVPLNIIAQTGPEKEGLRTDYLAQLIGLSCNEKSTMIDEKKATRRLLGSPLIKKAKVEQIIPGVLSIEYNMRKPYVLLGECKNVALDREGYPLPFFPFYTPKNMPRLYLGRVPIHWNIPLKQTGLAFEILKYLEEKIDLFTVKILDMRNAHHPLLGKKEIVIVIQEGAGRHTLRLLPNSYREAFARYLLIPHKQANQTIDLRLPNIGFIKTEKYD